MKEISVNGRIVSVEKLPLKKYAELLAAFEELPKHLSLISGKPQEEVLQNLPKLISTCYPDVVRVLMVATTMQPDEIDAMGLDDLMEVFVAILEVNNYSKVYENLKKLTARPAAQIAQSDGSGGQQIS